MNFNMLYESEVFVVVHLMPDAENKLGASGGFEIARKWEAEQVFLVGHEADAFAFEIKSWQHNTPTQEQVEETLENFFQLGVLPLITH